MSESEKATERQFGYEQMPPSVLAPEKKDDKETFRSDESGLREAAKDLTESRQGEATQAANDGVIDRSYSTTRTAGTRRPVSPLIRSTHWILTARVTSSRLFGSSMLPTLRPSKRTSPLR